MSNYEPIKTTKPAEIKLDLNYRSKILRLTEKQQYRFLEMIPGVFVWLTFITSIILSSCITEEKIVDTELEIVTTKNLEDGQ